MEGVQRVGGMEDRYLRVRWGGRDSSVVGNVMGYGDRARACVNAAACGGSFGDVFGSCLIF